MRPITHLVVHCSATKPSQDIGAPEIKAWHTTPAPKGRGWTDIGYHFVIRRSGILDTGRPVTRAGAHVAGHNKTTIGICLVGGLDEDGKPTANYTPEQYAMLRTLLRALLSKWSNAEVLGHRDFPGVAKECPCFDVKAWWANEIKSGG